MKSTEHELDRRGFLKSAAVVSTTAASVLAGAGSALATGTSSQSDSISGGVASSAATSATSTTVDAMSGEKYTGKWAFEIAPDPVPEDQITETIEADVVVVGAGTSGLVTANSAEDEGLNVVVISASTTPSSRGGSNNAVYSKAMEAAGIEKMNVWYIQKEILAQYNSVDQKKWYKYYNNSETATNWMIDIMEGAGFYTALEQNNYVKPDNIYGQGVCSHSWVDSSDSNMVSMNQQALVETIANRFTGEGGTIYYSMKGYQLERENNNTGRVTSVIAEDLTNGGYKRFTGTKAIVLAAGDFSIDRDMMYKYCPRFAPTMSDEAYDGAVNYDVGKQSGGLYRGDMHKAALWVGAGWQKTVPNCAMVSTRSAGATINRYENFFGLLLDRNGQRFMNEYASRALGPLTQSLQEGLLTYAIWDTGWFDHFTWYDNSYADQVKVPQTKEEVIAIWDAKVEKGTAVKADTIEDLVSQAGLPETAIDAINHYNDLCAAGSDADFYKDPDFLVPIATPPFYCEKSDYSGVLLHTVLGGPRCNDNCQVLDTDDNIIPGLYEVGTMMGDLFAGIYTFMIEGGNYGMACLTFGYLTGKYIAANES